MGTFLWLMLLFPGLCVLSSFEPYRFHVVKEEKTWAEAQQYCRKSFIDLATIDDMANVEELQRTIQEEGVTHPWIGLRYGRRPKWQWSLADRDFYGENETEFRNWETGQPGLDVGDCVYMRSPGQWCDLNCYQKYSFICYDGRTSKHPYVLVRNGKSWADAQGYCREHYTDLASVRNQTENDLIEAVRRPGGGEAWIGLFNDTWEWSDGSSSSVRHWKQGEPNGYHGNSLCVEMWSSGLWVAQQCDERRNFSCYEVLPTVEVLSPQSPFHPGDTVTMRCDIPKYTSHRQYVWLKDNSPVTGGTGQTITITLPEWADQYQCHRQREDSSVAPYVSKPVNITCNDLPAATVEVTSPPGPHYSGDVVTLECSVTQFEDWHQYVWLKDNSLVTGETSQTITITLPQGAGQYQCYGERIGRPSKSSPSSSVDIMNEDNLVLVNQNKTWVEAQQYCRQHHVDLVSVSSEKIQRWVEGWAKGASSPHVWMGLRYDCNFGVWSLVSGVPASYDNWASDADREEGCYGTVRVGAVSRGNGKWFSLEENEKLNFICINEAPSVWRTQIVRVTLQMASHVDVEDPEMQEAFLQQIAQRLKDKGLPANTQVSWRKQADGEVFHKQKEEVKKKQKRNEL